MSNLLARELCPMTMSCPIWAPLLLESLYLNSLPYYTRNHELGTRNPSEVSFGELSGLQRDTQMHVHRTISRDINTHVDIDTVKPRQK